MKSPAARTPQKAYKHVKFMPLSHVRRVVDIRDNEGMLCIVCYVLVDRVWETAKKGQVI